jgi:excisionase family DNA binding protein
MEKAGKRTNWRLSRVAWRFTPVSAGPPRSVVTSPPPTGARAAAAGRARQVPRPIAGRTLHEACRCTENVAKDVRRCILTGVSTTEPEGNDAIEWLSTAEAATRLGITPRTLYRFIDEGQLAAYRFGRVIRLKTSDVDTFIESCRIEPGTLEHLYPDSGTETSTTEASAT